MLTMSTCLWFDTQAEEAANFYVSVFPNSKIIETSHYPASTQKASGKPEGAVMTEEFELNGQRFLALNGGPDFKFNEAVSIVVYCETQAEIDTLYGKLSADPKAEMCGWLKDKYGLSWQIDYAHMRQLTSDKDEAKKDRVMAAMLQMKKLDIAALEAA